LRRYLNNLRSKSSPFTIIEGILATFVGFLVALLLKGSWLHYVAHMSSHSLCLTVAWIVALALFVGAVSVKASGTRAVRLPRNTEVSSTRDTPITDDEEDTLGRVPFVNDFYQEIKKFPFDEPVVFGLTGQWGTGKTSVLNLLRNRLRRDTEIILVDFNPWYFSSSDVLVHRFYSSVANAINREFFFPDLISLARRYSTILAPVLKRYGIDVSIADSNVEDLKVQVERYILQTGRRVVVLIDDIDRTSTDELLGVFRTVRLTAEFKKTTFVLSYDEAQVRAQLKTLDISPNYLEKIVQNPVPLPSLDQGSIDRYLLYSDAGHRSQLDVLFDKLDIGQRARKEFDERIVELYPAHIKPFFTTLRSAKRFLNSLNTRLPVIKDEVYLLDFILLEVLRVFAPHVYQDVHDSRNYYIPEWTWEETLASPFGVVDRQRGGELQKKVKAHVDDVLRGGPHETHILAILEELFFVRLKDSSIQYGDDFAASVRAKKRLTHPASFPKYFLLSVPRGAIPDRVIEDLFKSWSSVSDPSTLIKASFAEYQKRNDLLKLLDSIVLFLDDMDEGLVDPLLTCASSRIPPFPLASRDLVRTDFDGAFKLVLFLLNDKGKDVDKRRRLEHVLRNTPTVQFAIKIIGALVGTTAGLYMLQQAADIASAKTIVVERVRKEIVDAGVDIFESEPEVAAYILFQTGTYDDDSKQMINNYALQLCRTRPSNIGKLVGAFLLDIGHTSTFRLDELRLVYDSSALAALARTAGQNAWSTTNEQRAIEQLLKAEPGPDANHQPKP
jgi:predicted KAP-like P-loop ATPase